MPLSHRWDPVPTLCGHLQSNIRTRKRFWSKLTHMYYIPNSVLPKNFALHVLEASTGQQRAWPFDWSTCVHFFNVTVRCCRLRSGNGCGVCVRQTSWIPQIGWEWLQHIFFIYSEAKICYRWMMWCYWQLFRSEPISSFCVCKSCLPWNREPAFGCRPLCRAGLVSHDNIDNRNT